MANSTTRHNAEIFLKTTIKYLVEERKNQVITKAHNSPTKKIESHKNDIQSDANEESPARKKKVSKKPRKRDPQSSVPTEEYLKDKSNLCEKRSSSYGLEKDGTPDLRFICNWSKKEPTNGELPNKKTNLKRKFSEIDCTPFPSTVNTAKNEVDAEEPILVGKEPIPQEITNINNLKDKAMNSDEKLLTFSNLPNFENCPFSQSFRNALQELFYESYTKAKLRLNDNLLKTLYENESLALETNHIDYMLNLIQGSLRDWKPEGSTFGRNFFPKNLFSVVLLS